MKTEYSVLSFFCGLAAVILGTVAIFAWYAHIPVILQIRPGYSTTKFNTALLFLLSGAGLMLANLSRRREACALGVAITLVAGLTFSQFLFAVDFGIDQLFFKDYLMPANGPRPPGRMAVTTAFSFVLTGMALTIPCILRSRWPGFAAVLGTGIVIPNSILVSGYLFSMLPDTSWLNWSHVGISCSAGLLPLAAGIVVFAWRNEPRKTMGLPPWFPLLAGIGVMTGTITLWQADRADDEARFKQRMQMSFNSAKTDLVTGMEQQLGALDRVGQQWEHYQDEWDFDALMHREQSRGLLFIAWADAEGGVRWNLPAKSDVATFNEERAFERHRQEAIAVAWGAKTTVISRPIDFFVVGKGFLTFTPAYKKEVFDGFLAGAFNSRKLLDDILDKEAVSGLGLSISGDGETFYSQGEPSGAGTDKWAVASDISIRGRAWRLQVWPGQELMRGIHPFSTTATLVFGAAMSLLLGWAIYFAQQARGFAFELLKYRDHLQELVEQRTAELKSAQRQLLHSEKLSATGKLAASLAHEINSPIMSIRNILEQVYEDTLIKAEDKTLVSLAVTECDRIAALAGKLRDFHRPTMDVVHPLDLNAVIDDMLALARKKMMERRIKLEKHFDDELPAIEAVGDQIKQVVLNLLQNAEEAIDHKGGKITVTTAALPADGPLPEAVRFCVRDTGCGIPPEHLDSIFEPFFTTKGEGKGSGLGLAVSYGIVKNHGGDIQVESQPGAGTAFTVTLPLKYPRNS